MALGYLRIFFIAITVISGLGLTFLYMTKNEKIKKRLFYGLAVWAMSLAVINATSLPTNYIAQQVIAWGLGLLSIIGIVVYAKGNTVKQYNIGYSLVTLSILLTLFDLFMF